MNGQAAKGKIFSLPLSALLIGCFATHGLAISFGQPAPLRAIGGTAIVKSKIASGGSQQKPRKSIGSFSFETQTSIRFTLTLSAKSRRTGYKDSMNLYQAFNMNGLNFVDPMGEAISRREFYAYKMAELAETNNRFKRDYGTTPYTAEHMKEITDKAWLAYIESQNAYVDEMPGTWEAFKQGIDPFKQKIDKAVNALPDYAEKKGKELWAVNRGKMDPELEGEFGYLQDRYKQGSELVGDISGTVAREALDQVQWITILGIVGKIHRHHTYPKSLGGHPDQELSELLDFIHLKRSGVHSDLAKFEGGWLYPRKGRSGKMIVDMYGTEAVEEGLRRFYSQDKWKHLLSDYENAVIFTKEMNVK